MASTAERRRRSNGSAETPEWVPVRSAAEEAGISVSTLRNWYRKGLIESRTSNGSSGTQKMVRRVEVLERAHAGKAATATDETAVSVDRDASAAAADDPATSEVPAEQAPIASSEERSAPRTTYDADVVAVVPQLARELADAGERAGRAEARLEFVTAQLNELRAQNDEERKKVSALEQENVALQRRVRQLEAEVARLSQAAPGDTDEDDDYEEMSPEEEDQFLALTQRRKARRKRKRAARKEARAARR